MNAHVYEVTPIMRLNKTLISILLILINLMLSSWIVGQTTRQSVKMSLTNGNHSLDKKNSSLITLLCSGNESQAQVWETHFQFIQHQQLLIGSENSSVKIMIEQPLISGDQEYRQFNIGYALIPYSISGYVIEGRTGFHQIFTQNLTEYPFNFSIPLNTFIGHDGISVKLEKISFTDEQFRKLQEYLRQINQYWALSENVNDLLKESELYENQNKNQMDFLFIFREKIRKSLILLKETADFEVLKLAGTDPAGLWPHYSTLERLLIRYTTLCQEEMKEINQPDETIAEVAHAMIKASLKVIKQAYTTDFRSHELNLRMARVMPDENFFLLTNELRSDQEPFSLTGKISFNLVTLADSLFDAGDFVHAIGFYEDARQLLKELKQDNAVFELNERIESAQLGLLRSYIQISKKAFQSGNEELAKSYQEKSNYIVTRHPENNLINRISGESDELIKAYLDKGNQLIDQKQYLEAVNVLEQAESTARTFYNLRFQTSISQSRFIAYRSIFLDLVKDAEQFFIIGEKDEAQKRLQYALNYQNDHIQFLRTSNEALHLQQKINQENTKEALMGQSVGELQGFGTGSALAEFNIDQVNKSIAETEKTIIKLIKDAQLKVWANEMDAAWRIYEHASDLAKESFLDKKPSIKSAFSALDNRMIERICLNHTFTMNDLKKQSFQLLRRKDYGPLARTVEESLNLAAENQGCGLDAGFADSISVIYKDAFEYVENYEALLSTFYTGGLKALIPVYLIFDEQTEKFGLDRFDIKHIDLRQFIASQQNGDLTMQAVVYFLDQMNPEAMKLYLSMLKNQTFTVAWPESIQEKIAALLAVADHAQSITDPESKIDAVLGVDKRFSFIKKHYLRSMKQLDRKK